MDGKLDTKTVPGKNLTLGLDLELQALGERLMEGKLGSIVAIEPSTGEVLCMVSSPTYDPRMMVGRQRGKNHLALSRNPLKPLLNRSIMGQYPPGSTFKTTQALTFLQEGIITPETAYPCYHGFIYRGLKVGCLQCLFLLGTLLHVRQPDEIQECAGGHDGVERLYGVDGVRV